jgi:thiol-disulfide isomerase/thioredoxin
MTPSVPTAPEPDSRRRLLLFAGVGAAAALSGAGVALLKRNSDTPADVDPSFWRMSFDSPSGSALSMQAFRGKPLLVNFWATWCPPCVEEMPMLDAFFRQSSAKGWQLLGLAIDQPTAVRNFLQRTPVSYPIGLAGVGGSELSKVMGNDGGGLPFTVVIGGGGQMLRRKMGRISQGELSQWEQLK